MNFYIPSSGRSARQDTLMSLPDELLEKTTLVVPKDEYEDYRRKWERTVKVVGPDIPKGVGPARQWCCDQEERKCIMLDDDLVFATRREDEPTKFRDTEPHEIEEAMLILNRRLDIYSHVGMATREGGNRDTNKYARNTRLLRVLGYDTKAMRKHNVRFDQIPVMEDFFVSLSLLTKGLENSKLNWLVQNQRGSGAEGGCSQYRTPEVQAQAALTLHAYFPDFVTVVQKETKTAWGGGTRTDVRIAWKKAYDWGVANA